MAMSSDSSFMGSADMAGSEVMHGMTEAEAIAHLKDLLGRLSQDEVDELGGLAEAMHAEGVPS